MKSFLPAILLFASLTADAANTVTVESGKTTTAPGIGGTAQLGYAFAKGDVITLDAQADKKMQMVLIYLYPETPVLGRTKYTKKANISFTMPQDGIVLIRFVSDRPGTNDISYTVTRMPASDAVQHYNTRIVWQKPTDQIGVPVPKREGE